MLNSPNGAAGEDSLDVEQSIQCSGRERLSKGAVFASICHIDASWAITYTLAPFNFSLLRHGCLPVRSDIGTLLRHHAWILLTGLFVFFIGLGAARLWDEDETEYARCAREMMARGDWVKCWRSKARRP